MERSSGTARQPTTRRPESRTGSMDDIDIEQDNDAFAVPELWRSSRFALPDLESSTTLFHEPELDINSTQVDNPYAPSKNPQYDLRLPDLENFQYGPLEDLESVQESTVSSLPTQQLEESETIEEDIWRLATDLGPVHRDIKFYTWESFEKPGSREPAHPYIAEAGPEAFDQAVAQAKDATQPVPSGQIVRTDIVLGSLFNLGLGRSSALFKYDRDGNTFLQAIRDARVSGLSLQSAQSLIHQFVEGGSTFRYLNDFAEKTFKSNQAFPSQVALANAVGTIISVMEDHLGDQWQFIRSTLQLQQLLQRPHRILGIVRHLIESVKFSRSNEEMISVLYWRVQEMEQEDPLLRSIFQEILKSVSEPWLEFAAQWAGLRHAFNTEFTPETVKDTFVYVEEPAEDGPGITEHAYQSEHMPAFVSDEDGRMVFETGKSLRFLEQHHPKHPLCKPRSVGVEPPPLEWKFGWEDLDNISAKARRYERDLADAVRKFGSIKRSEDKLGSKAEQSTEPPVPKSPQYEWELQETMELFDEAPRTEEVHGSTTLHRLVLACLSTTSTADNMHTFAPPLSLTPSLSLTPLFLAQARLVNATTLRLFFQSHNLRLHISIQRQYQLLGDGVFMSRLTSALFSPDLETAERRRGTVRTGAPMGLKLGSRSTNWPPASSELRLALMGVLSESYQSSRLYNRWQQQQQQPNPQIQKHHHHRETPDIPGNLSFAIRILQPAEIDQVMDPHSLYALDFLRLQYTPPAPLHLVLTPAILDKYDACFRLLLRLARMLFVVTHQLPRPSSFCSSSGSAAATTALFRLEAHHFVTAVAAHFFDDGVGAAWDAFEADLDALERRIVHASSSSITVGLEGLETLRAAHDAVLENILFALLLRRRQRPVMQLLEDIFDTILSFATTISNHDDDDNDNNNIDDDAGSGAAAAKEAERNATVLRLHAAFRAKLAVFVRVCRGLVGKRGPGSTTTSSNATTSASSSGAGGGGATSARVGMGTTGLRGAGAGAGAGAAEPLGGVERLLLRLEMSGYYEGVFGGGGRGR
ncbi:Spc98 family-domain-containing protein [Phyllosticta citriasiana]|uniref:Spindle pole body component n=1 Tax=Phyllosticta citriasiana TaxID=595635 RepID=A0ABR1KYV6_9PEZI